MIHVPMIRCRLGGCVMIRQSLILFAVAALTGCSGGDPNFSEVSGSVTVDGQPLKEGNITFSSVSGNAPSAGGPIADGKYAAKVHIGSTKVEIRASKVVGQKKVYDTPDSPVQPIMEEVLPAKYNEQTELTLEVEPGTTVKDFDLSTK
jgi:hypothetical protein